MSARRMTRILIVDDEPALVELVRGYLACEGYEVMTVFDGISAIAGAQATSPDLIVLDLMPPQLDGIEVCRHIRQMSDAYVLMLTARAEEVDKLIGLSVGADDIPHLALMKRSSTTSKDGRGEHHPPRYRVPFLSNAAAAMPLRYPRGEDRIANLGYAR